MNLLIITQIVDRKDSSLGAIHKWIEALAERFNKINVICLKKGEVDLPKNVTVWSLGKEDGESRIKYLKNFYKYTWFLRREYETVFVHMNQEYILLAGLLWKMLGKKIFMWRNHYDGSFLTDIAAMFCNKVFCTSKFSYTAKYKKTVIMPVGVDVSSCKLDEKIKRIPNTILFLGRMSEAKRPHILIDALGILKKGGVDFKASFVGPPKTKEYTDLLKTQVEALGISNNVKFIGPVPNTETYRYYRSSEIYVNASRSGMFDKSLFKSVACGCLPLATSLDFKDLVGDEFIFPDNNSNVLAEKLKIFLIFSTQKKTKLKEILAGSIKRHSLETLTLKLKEEMSI